MRKFKNLVFFLIKKENFTKTQEKNLVIIDFFQF